MMPLEVHCVEVAAAVYRCNSVQRTTIIANDRCGQTEYSTKCVSIIGYYTLSIDVAVYGHLASSIVCSSYESEAPIECAVPPAVTLAR